MSMLLRVIASISIAALTAGDSLGAQPGTAAATAARDIREARARHNRAIAAHDLDGIARLWSPDRVQVSSRNGRTFGIEAERETFAQLFVSRPGLIFVRTPATVYVNTRWLQAAESGTWTGSWNAADGAVRVGGSYFAKWLKENGAWRIIAETYVQLSCTGGQYCAEVPAIDHIPTLDAARAAIDSANARWQAATIAGDAATFAATFTDDATFSVPMAPTATGRSAIERMTRDWLSAVRVDSVRLSRNDLKLVGDIAIESGTVRTGTTPRAGGAGSVDVAHYLTVWQRQSDGRWLIARDMTTTAPPGTAR